MKLFIWNSPYPVSYGQSMLIVVARDEQEARAIAAQQNPAYAYGDCPQDPMFGPSLGPVTRVVDAPCAEWHEWSE